MWIATDPWLSAQARGRGPGHAGLRARGERRGGYWSLNMAIAVPPEVTLTLRVFVAPDGGLQLTE